MCYSNINYCATLFKSSQIFSFTVVQIKVKRHLLSVVYLLCFNVGKTAWLGHFSGNICEIFKSEDNDVETKQWYFEIFLQTNIDKIKLFPWFFESSPYFWWKYIPVGGGRWGGRSFKEADLSEEALMKVRFFFLFILVSSGK